MSKPSITRGALPPQLMNIGAGVDGSALMGTAGTGRAVVVHRLKPEVLKDPLRRRRLERRIAFERAPATAPLGVERVLLAEFEGTPPIVVVEDPGTPALATTLPLLRSQLDRGLRVLASLARALAAAHADGIAHGTLSPTAIRLAASSDDPIVSVLGLHTGYPAAADDRWTRRFISDEGTTAGDAAAFGGLCALVALDEPAAWSFLDNPTTFPSSPGVSLLLDLARELLDVEPAWRPALSEVTDRLTTIARLVGDAPEGATVVEAGGAPQSLKPAPPEPPPNPAKDRQPTVGPDQADTLPIKRKRLGRFTLIDRLGAGAMGEVWRGVDEESNEAVAVKILNKDVVATDKAKRRFKKEARLLSELRNPGIARFIEAGELAGIHYLVTELVRGKTLSATLTARGPLPERDAALLVADVARALIDVHVTDIVHRDIKPDNVIVVKDARSAGTSTKLIDFGVARHVDETTSLAMTRQGAVLGTPLYMSPEQARGALVDARSDLYALGVTLYELLVGEAPFAGHGVAQVLAMQLEVRPARVRDLRPGVSEELSNVVAKCLEKDPANRYQDARELVDALWPLTGQQIAKPATPSSSARRFVFTFPMSSAPSALWPFVSNTERLNKAIGIGAVEESFGLVDNEVARFGAARQAGMQLTWREHPYEWVFERRLGVLREYSEGPLRSLRSTVELAPDGTGTRLTQIIEVEPRGLLGRAAIAVEVGVRTKRALEKTYGRIDSLLQGRLGSDIGVDAFEPAEQLSIDVEHRFMHLERFAVAQGAAPRAIEVLGTYLRLAPTQELSRLRPLALARRFKQPETTFVDACYFAASVGLMKPMWDLLCPSCRVPSSIEETLKALRAHGRCEACNLEFSLDLASSIELVFQVHPSLRRADPQTYCLGSPAHTPHVVVQVRVPIGERVSLDVALPEGYYQLTCRGTELSQPLRVKGSATAPHLEVSLSAPPSKVVRTLPKGRQELAIVNDTDRAQLVRVERSALRDDVLTAVRALSSSLFKRLFPGEVLSDGALLRVAQVTMVLIEPVDHRSREEMERLYTIFRAIDELIAAHGGAVVRLHGEGVLASFDDPVAAARAVMSLASSLSRPEKMRAAIHRESCGAVTLNQRLDYFGACVQEVIELVARAGPGEVLVSDAIAGDPGVIAALDGMSALEATLADGGVKRRFSRTSSSQVAVPAPSA